LQIGEQPALDLTQPRGERIVRGKRVSVPSLIEPGST
jgi:hypothetical protein